MKGAVNVPTQEQLRQMFFGSPENLRALLGAVIIFHCEFSSGEPGDLEAKKQGDIYCTYSRLLSPNDNSVLLTYDESDE